MRAEILTIGTELLNGTTVNTNAADLARRLADIGLACDRQAAVPDDRARIAAAIREALDRSDLVLLTGGLGPTFDDLTLEALADATGLPLVVRPAVARQIRRFYARHHRTLQQAALRQAWLPRGALALPNPIGTAPGIWLPVGRQLLIALPGVPREMRPLLERHVLPRLRRLPGRGAIASRTLRTMGLVELQIESVLRRARLPASIAIGLYPNLRAVDIRMTVSARTAGAARAALTHSERRLRRRLRYHLYGTDDESLEAVVGRLLLARRLTLAVAESCTGGLVTHRLTEVAGSSRYLVGGIVAYDNRVKRTVLDVPAPLLERYGAVSRPVACAMARGARERLGAAVGLSITGIAGPSGGTPRKPVGLVVFGVASGRRVRSVACRFVGDRSSIKAQAAQTALDWLRRHLIENRH